MGGGSKSTTTTTVTQTEEEKEFTRQQIELAKQQLALTEEQHGWQSEIYELTKPMLEKYGLMFDQQYDEYMAEGAATLRDKYRQLESAQVDQQLANMPLQQELLEYQIDEIRRGGRATDEQKALIAEITQRGIDAGESDISSYLQRGLGQIRDELAPARGMRPDDAPMIDQGEELAMEAIRQQGQLITNARGAQANAELNFPLNASQAYSQQATNQQNIQSSMNQFLQGLRQQAVANRSQFQAQAFQAPMSAGEQGIGLINASRPTPVSFPRNTTETTKTSGGGSILGGIGGALSGIAQVGSLFSTKKAKTNIKPLADGQHLLSPGALKTNISPLRTDNLGEDMMNPFALKDFRERNETNDQYAALGNRWHPDGVRDPINTGWIKNGPKPLPAPPPGTIERMIANQPPIPVGYRPGQMPDSDEDMLQRVAALPVSTWQYKPETGMGSETHIGPMAEDFNTRVVGKGPEPLISTVDAIGSLMSSVKALDKRTRNARSIAPTGYRGRNVFNRNRNIRAA